MKILLERTIRKSRYIGGYLWAGNRKLAYCLENPRYAREANTEERPYYVVRDVKDFFTAALGIYKHKSPLIVVGEFVTPDDIKLSARTLESIEQKLARFIKKGSVKLVIKEEYL